MKENVKEKINKSLKAVKDFIESDFFIYFTGAAVALCSISNLFMVGFCISAISICAVLFTNIKMRACLPPIIMIVFNLSSQRSTYNGDMSIAKTGNIVIFAILGAGVVAGLIYAFIKKGIKVRITPNFWGLVCICVALTFGGVFSPIYSLSSMLVGAALSVFFLGGILLFGSFVKKEDFPYIAKTLITMSLVVCLELLHLYAYNEELRKTFEKGLVQLGFGISNSIGIMILVGMPFTLYYMAVSKRSIVFCLVLVVQTLGIVFTFARASLVIAVPLIIAGGVYACFRNKGRGRYQILIFAAVVAVVGVSFIAAKWEKFSKMMAFYLEVGFDDRGRTEIWEHGIMRFLTSPVTGVGIIDKVTQTVYNDDLTKLFILRYHNNIFQFLVVGGIIGICLYIAHNVILALTCVANPKETRSFAMLGILMIIGNSLLDVMFYYPYTILIYTMLIAFCESDLISQNELNANLLKRI